jgi:hypothetical protein
MEPGEITGEVFEQATAIKPRVDREAGIIRRAHVLGNESRHGYKYALEAQRVAAKRFEGMLVGIDHDYQQRPMTVQAAFGTLRNPEVDDKGTWADLHYLKTHVRSEQILEDLERGTGIFALSAVNAQVIERDKVVTSFLPIRVDVVAGGATTRTVLEQLPPAELKALREELAAAKTAIAELQARQTKYEQYVVPQASASAAVAAASAAAKAKGIDLKKFWNDPKGA